MKSDHKSIKPSIERSVAVVVPCYNAAATIRETLDSVIGQPDVLEIVAIDDGSIDRTLETLRSFEPHIRVLTGPNAGVSAARNRGIAETRAPWLLFLDADDLLMPGTIEQRLKVAHASIADVVITEWQDVIDDGSVTLQIGAHHVVDWAALEADPVLATAVHVWATTAAILYRRDIVERIGGFRLDLPVIQDARFLFDAAFHGAKFVHAPHVGALYRVLAGSLSRRNPSRFSADILRNGLQIEQLWRARGELSAGQIGALASIYNTAARGLFSAAHPCYFQAIAAQRRLGAKLPKHTKIAGRLATFVGLDPARRLMALIGRG